MELHLRDGATVIQVAQEWARELQSADQARRREFVHWIRYSPEHLKTFLRVMALETELTGIKDTKELDLDTLLPQLAGNFTSPLGTDPPAAAESVGRAISGTFSTSRAFRLIGVAAGLAVLALVSWVVARQPVKSSMDRTEFTTDIGQR